MNAIGRRLKKPARLAMVTAWMIAGMAAGYAKEAAKRQPRSEMKFCASSDSIPRNATMTDEPITIANLSLVRDETAPIAALVPYTLAFSVKANGSDRWTRMSQTFMAEPIRYNPRRNWFRRLIDRLRR